MTIKNNFRARLDYGWALIDSKDPIEPVKAGSNQIYLQFNILF